MYVHYDHSGNCRYFWTFEINTSINCRVSVIIYYILFIIISYFQLAFKRISSAYFNPHPPQLFWYFKNYRTTIVKFSLLREVNGISIFEPLVVQDSISFCFYIQGHICIRLYHTVVKSFWPRWWNWRKTIIVW